ncbi:MAG: Capsule synthesis protein CapA [Actinotalea sp.]|nr:Capsule synthesis protein CapA [Actinotalea sp.]
MTRPVEQAPRSRGARAAVVAVVLVIAAALTLATLVLTGTLPLTPAQESLGDGPAQTDEPDGEDATTEPSPSPTPTPTPTPPPDAVFTLVAAGDVLLHEPVIGSARTPAGGYDFAPLLEPIRPWVSGADLALCHLETPVAPPGTGFSGFPLFGGPAEIAAGLAANGWDGCSTASNHSVDRGQAGVRVTLDALDAAGLGHVGTARTAEEAVQPQLYQLVREGRTITVAHLSATYGTNGMPIPADAPWAVTVLDTAALVAQATAARAAGADVVVASVHCCVEYVTTPTDVQLTVAAELAASGVVDLLIGHHAHVPQPLALLPGGPGGAGMWVAYGLGNLISNQDDDCCTAVTDSGLLMTATFRAPADGPVRVTGVEWTSITVDRFGGHTVQPMSAAVQAGQGAGTLAPADLVTRQARVLEAIGAGAPERVTPPVATGPPPLVVPRPAPVVVPAG